MVDPLPVAERRDGVEVGDDTLQLGPLLLPPGHLDQELGHRDAQRHLGDVVEVAGVEPVPAVTPAEHVEHGVDHLLLGDQPHGVLGHEALLDQDRAEPTVGLRPSLGAEDLVECLVLEQPGVHEPVAEPGPRCRRGGGDDVALATDERAAAVGALDLEHAGRADDGERTTDVGCRHLGQVTSHAPRLLPSSPVPRCRDAPTGTAVVGPNPHRPSPYRHRRWALPCERRSRGAEAGRAGARRGGDPRRPRAG